MKASEIITLLEAGYTKSEIDMMESGEASEDPKAGEDTGEAAGASEDPEAGEDTGEAAGASEAAATAGWLREIAKTVNDEIEKLKNAYQEYNMNMANNKEQVSKGSTEIIGEIINPPYIFKDKEGEK